MWPLFVNVGPWPWSLLNLLSAALCVVAVTMAWHATDRVAGESRGLTRTWRILMIFVVALSINGIWLPFGAAYVVVRRPWSSWRVGARLVHGCRTDSIVDLGVDLTLRRHSRGLNLSKQRHRWHASPKGTFVRPAKPYR